MIVEMPDNNSVVRWKKSDKEKWKYAEISDLITTYEERPRGIWTRTGQSFVNPNKFRNFCCSNCLWELDEHIRTGPNFCPNCGADMRGNKE